MRQESSFTEAELAEARQYQIVIQWSIPDQLFIGSVPEFGNIKTHGSTAGEAADNALEMAADYIYGMRAIGREIPTPKSLAAAS